ncbi:PLP-dependent aspartate aminotransferase family protein [Planctomycetota bacterium]|nr:PLP-dependent aspartate aminotransferase family protein [Planctomycetota bacterium]
MADKKTGKGNGDDSGKQRESMPIPENASMSTYLVHGRPFDENWDFSHHIVPPMSASVTYRLDSTQRGCSGFADFASAAEHKHEPIFIYDRLDEPTRSMLESTLARAENGDCCVAFATGMAAISAALGICLDTGDHAICHQAVYGCTYSLMTTWYKRLGIEVDFVNMRDLEAIKTAIRPNTRVLFTESPVNPNLELIDIKALRRLADEANTDRPEEERPCRVIIDNTFATPYGQRPLDLGAHIVCHSLTKNIGGFGTDMGGAVIADESLEGELLVWRKDFGGALSSRSAWNIMAYGLPTMPLRVASQAKTAMEVATWLNQHPDVSSVIYPGLSNYPQRKLALEQMRTPEGEFMPGTLIYFETREDSEHGSKRCAKLMDYIADKAYTITLAVSLGQLRTLIESPGIMTHSALPLEQLAKSGVYPNSVRISMGVESAADIIRDLDSAFEAIDG